MHPTKPHLCSLLPWLLLLGSCGTAPKPPSVDESRKRPANAVAAVELQACRNELHNARIVAREAERTADTRVALALAARYAQMAAGPWPARPGEPALPDTTGANGVYTVRFDFGSTRVHLPAELAAALVDEARHAPLVLLRGRTDGTRDAPAESRIARERATAVRDALVAAGVDPARIRATYQPIGDHVADNAKAQGREQNRRVEIEIYRSPPVALSAAPVALP